MGEIIVRKVRGMNWKAKISLVLIFTMVFSTFLYQGLKSPKTSAAATATYYLDQDTGTTVATGVVTSMGTCGNITGAAGISLMKNVTQTCATANFPRSGATGLMYTGYYNTAYGSDTKVTGQNLVIRLRDQATGGFTASFQLVKVSSGGTVTNFNGAAVTQAVASGTDQDYTINLSSQSGILSATDKLGIQMSLTVNGSTSARFYIGSTASVATTPSGVLTVDEVTLGPASSLVKSGTFKSGTATGNVSVTGVGFQPKAVIFYYSRQNATGFSAAERIGSGFAADTSGGIVNRGVASACDDNVATTNCGRRRSETDSIMFLSAGTPTLSGQGSVTAFGADGFTVNFSTAPGVDANIYYIAIGGTDVTNAGAGTFNLTTTGTTDSVNTLGFQPDFVFFLSTSTEAVDTNTANAVFNMGFASAAAEQASISTCGRDAQAAVGHARSQQRTDNVLTGMTTACAQDWLASFTSFDAGGFTVTRSDNPAANTPVFYLALKGPAFHVGADTQATSVTTKATTGTGFTPEGLFMASFNRATGTTIAAQGEISMGSTTDRESGSAWGETRDVINSDANMYNDSSNALVMATTAATEAEAKFQSFDANGYTLNWTKADATARQFIYFAVGKTPISLTIANGTNPADKTVYRNDCDKAVDTFTLQATGGDVTVSQIVFTGNANLTAGNVLNVELREDNGTTPNEVDGSDSFIASGTIAGNAATFSGLSLSITAGTTKTFTVAYDFSGTVNSGLTFTGNIGSAVTSNAGTTSGSDSGSATLTTAAMTLTVGEDTNPSDKTVQQGSTNNAVASFTLSLSAGPTSGAIVSQIVITGTNPTFVTANGVELWRDNGTTPNEWDAGDTQIGTGVSFSGSTATFSSLNENVLQTAQHYIVTYDISTGATVGQTTTGYISGITSDANVNTNSDNNTDATLTISAGTCTRNAPTVDFGGNGTVTPGNNKVYTLTVTNNDAPAAFCGSTSFSLAINPAESGDTGSFNIPSTILTTPLSVTAGASNSTTFTVSAKAGATLGHQLNSTVRATDATNHNLLPGSGSVTTTVITSYSNDNLLHNSTNLASSYWSGSWGVPGGKYGAFVCETCHSKSTTNIKRVKTSISTPDSSNWTSNSSPSVTVSFTNFTNATGAMGQDTTHATSDRVCEVCHSQTGVHKYNQPSGATHNGVVDCTICHKHNAAFSGDGPCLSCHNATQSQVYTTRNVSSDFTRLSRHVNDGTATSIVTNYDCVVCHAEGDADKVAAGTGWLDKSMHTNGSTSSTRMVKLRNVDNRTQTYDFNKNVLASFGTTTTRTMRDNMDTFCMNCHDSNGASDIAVNNSNPANGLILGSANTTTTTRSVAGAVNANPNSVPVNLRPFNLFDNLRNGRDATATGGNGTIGAYRTSTYGRVLNVKDQFNSTNQTGKNWASHHNLRQFTKRYTTRDTTAWPNAAWTTYTTKDNVNIQTGGEIAGLHCSDCHLNETNAHGSVNAWYMLQSKAGNRTPGSESDTAPTTTGDALIAAENMCFRCHSSAVYASDAGSATNGRYSHTNDCAGSRLDGITEYPFGIQCQGCHGGYGETTDSAGSATPARGGLGAIHGTNETYLPGGETVTTSKRYRFMSGAANRRYTPRSGGAYATDADWEGTNTYDCYTGFNDTWSNCNNHDGGEAQTPNRARTLVY